MTDPREPGHWDGSESDAPDELRRALIALSDAERPRVAELQRLRERSLAVFETPAPPRLRALRYALGGAVGTLAIGLAIVGGLVGWLRFERGNAASLPPSAAEEQAVASRDQVARGERRAAVTDGADATTREVVSAAVRGEASNQDDVSAAVGGERERGRERERERSVGRAGARHARHAPDESADLRANAVGATGADGRASQRSANGRGLGVEQVVAAPRGDSASDPATPSGVQAYATDDVRPGAAGTHEREGVASSVNIVRRDSPGDGARARDGGARSAGVASRDSDGAAARVRDSDGASATSVETPDAHAEVRARSAATRSGTLRSPAADGGEDVLLDEATLLQRARRLSSRDPEGALRVLAEHKRRFAAGMLAPEREVLAIELLRSLSRSQEAELRAREFRRDYPRSVYLPRVEP